MASSAVETAAETLPAAAHPRPVNFLAKLALKGGANFLETIFNTDEFQASLHGKDGKALRVLKKQLQKFVEKFSLGRIYVLPAQEVTDAEGNVLRDEYGNPIMTQLRYFYARESKDWHSTVYSRQINGKVETYCYYEEKDEDDGKVPAGLIVSDTTPVLKHSSWSEMHKRIDATAASMTNKQKKEAIKKMQRTAYDNFASRARKLMSTSQLKMVGGLEKFLSDVSDEREKYKQERNANRLTKSKWRIVRYVGLALLFLIPACSAIMEACIGSKFVGNFVSDQLTQHAVSGAHLIGNVVFYAFTPFALAVNFILLYRAFDMAMTVFRHGSIRDGFMRGLTYDAKSKKSKSWQELTYGEKFKYGFLLTLTLAGLIGYIALGINSALGMLDVVGVTAVARVPISLVLAPFAMFAMGALFFTAYVDVLKDFSLTKSFKNFFLKYYDVDGKEKFLTSKDSWQKKFGVVAWNTVWAVLKVSVGVTIFWTFSVIMSKAVNPTVSQVTGAHFQFPGAFPLGGGNYGNALGLIAAIGESFFFTMAVWRLLDVARYALQVLPYALLNKDKARKLYVEKLRTEIEAPLKYLGLSMAVVCVNAVGFCLGMAGTLGTLSWVAASSTLSIVKFAFGYAGSFGANTPSFINRVKALADKIKEWSSCRKAQLNTMLKDAKAAEVSDDKPASEAPTSEVPTKEQKELLAVFQRTCILMDNGNNDKDEKNLDKTHAAIKRGARAAAPAA